MVKRTWDLLKRYVPVVALIQPKCKVLLFASLLVYCFVTGITVDRGVFVWGAGMHLLFDKPDTSNRGLQWGHDLPEALSPLDFKMCCLTIPLCNLGAYLSPDYAWMVVQGIEILSLHMEHYCENSLQGAEYLIDHAKVSWVRYPGLSNDSQYALAQRYLKGRGGPMVVFGLKANDDQKAGQLFINSLDLFSHIANVGDCKLLAIHPVSTTQS